MLSSNPSRSAGSAAYVPTIPGFDPTGGTDRTASSQMDQILAGMMSPQIARTPGGSMADIGAIQSAATAPAPGSTAAPGAPGAMPMVQPGGTVGGAMADWTKPGADQLYRNPDLMLRDIFNQQYGGINHDQAGTGLYYQTQPYMAYANALAFLSNGNNPMASQDYGNWLNQYATGLTTPGVFTNTNQLMSNLFNPGGGTALGNYLGVGDAATQVSRTLQLMKALTDEGMHPLYAQAMMAKAAEMGTQFQLDAAHGKAQGPFYNQLGNAPLFNRY